MIYKTLVVFINIYENKLCVVMYIKFVLYYIYIIQMCVCVL